MYLVDSKVLIEAKKRYYPFDLFPVVWDWIRCGHESGALLFIDEVVKEITSGADELSAWVKNKLETEKIIQTKNKDLDALATVTQWAQESHCTGNPKNHDMFCKHCVAVALVLQELEPVV
jgi:Domain of unknown function (DUF4411)